MRPDIKEACKDETLWLVDDITSEIAGIHVDHLEPLRKEWDHRSIAWKELLELEPRLAALLGVIHATKVPSGKDPAKLWYAHIKPRLMKLVGYTATRKNPALRSSAAYDTAYQKLYKELIEQRNCEHATEEFPKFWDGPATQPILDGDNEGGVWDPAVWD